MSIAFAINFGINNNYAVWILSILFFAVVFTQLYYNHTEALWTAKDRVPKVCAEGTFAERYMIDGVNETFWQSSSRNRLYAAPGLGEGDLDTIIAIDLHQVLVVLLIQCTAYCKCNM